MFRIRLVAPCRSPRVLAAARASTSAACAASSSSGVDGSGWERRGGRSNVCRLELDAALAQSRLDVPDPLRGSSSRPRGVGRRARLDLRRVSGEQLLRRRRFPRRAPRLPLERCRLELDPALAQRRLDIPDPARRPLPLPARGSRRARLDQRRVRIQHLSGLMLGGPFSDFWTALASADDLGNALARDPEPLSNLGDTGLPSSPAPGSSDRARRVRPIGSLTVAPARAVSTPPAVSATCTGDGVSVSSESSASADPARARRALAEPLGAARNRTPARTARPRLKSNEGRA